MKKIYIFCGTLIVIACVTLFVISCKKASSTSNGCSFGGILTANQYIVWIRQDFKCGVITVKLFEDGKEIDITGHNTINVYDPLEPVSPCDNNDKFYNNRARLSLFRGHTYTYTAACSSKTWSGTIPLACDEPYTCHLIELK